MLLIKLADRLHNAAPGVFVPAGSAAGRETRYAPLAPGLNGTSSGARICPSRVGEIYAEMVRMVSEHHAVLNEARTNKERLAQVGIEATVAGRPKHYYSINQKMKTKVLRRINDMRIMVEEGRNATPCSATMLSLAVDDFVSRTTLERRTTTTSRCT